MRWQLFKSWGLVSSLLVVGFGLTALLFSPIQVITLRNFIFDQYQRWQPRDYVNAPVRIVDIDDESLRRIGQWPWPRTRMADLVSKLQEAKSSAIALDILLAEPDRTSPQFMLNLWGTTGKVREAIGRLPDHDIVFSETLAKGRVVLGVSVERQVKNSLLTDVSSPNLDKHFGVGFVGESPLLYVHEYARVTPTLSLFQKHAAGVGAIAFEPDADGVVRRVPLLVQIAGNLLPTLTAEALRVSQGTTNYITRTSPVRGVGLQEIRVGQVSVPTTSQGEAWLYYTKPIPERYIPAWKILEGDVPTQDLMGSIVLVGTSAQGLMDLRFSALGSPLPGVEVHAQLLEQELNGEGLSRPTWAIAIEALVILIAGLSIGLTAMTYSALWSLGIFAILLATIWGGAWAAFSRYHLLLDPMLPSLVLLLTYFVSSIAHHYSSERSQRWIKQVFSRYVSPNLVAHMIDHPNELSIGGKRQECSFVFTDLSGFTKLMEGLDPAKAVTLLNEYLDHMIAIAFAHDGTLDRIVGDAVAIMFSAPVMQLDHQQRALDCAIEMNRFAKRHMRELEDRGFEFCQTRIAVHSGEVIVGNFGGMSIFDYRALGDPVNTAARLESANKQLGTTLIASADTLSGCSDVRARPIGQLLVQGKTKTIAVFEPFDPTLHTPSDDDYYSDYGHAYELMSQGDRNALAEFKSLLRQRPDDALVVLHIERLRQGSNDDIIVLAQK